MLKVLLRFVIVLFKGSEDKYELYFASKNINYFLFKLKSSFILDL